MLTLSDSAFGSGLAVGTASATTDSEPLLVVDRISKRYEIYSRPQDRLKQSIVPRVQALLPADLRRAQPFFTEFWALKDISLTVKRGEALGILGRNGAGKSTLLQIIAGTLAPTSGTVAVRGRTAALLELGSGFSTDFTGRENVRLNASLLGLSQAEIDERFNEIAAFADIGDFIEQTVKTYSSGMIMRLAFAVQTAVEPDLLIVDEALAVGDARFQKKCFDRLEKLKDKGTTILFVTHDTGAIVQFCSSAMILEGGSILSHGRSQEIARQYHRLLFSGDDLSDLSDRSTGRTRRENDVSDEASAATDFASMPSSEVSSEVRYGNGRAEIFAIGIRDASGNPTRLIEVHDEYEFYFRFRLNEDIDSPIAYGLMISNQKGVEIFATKAALYKKAIPPSKASTVYECRFRASMPIVPGTYFLSASIAHDDGRLNNEFLDYRFDALQFQVVGVTRSFATSIVDVNGELAHSIISG